MNFVRHSNLEGKHALLGASRWQWLNDDDEALINRIKSSYATEIGTALHAIAADRIKYGFKLSKAEKKDVILALYKSGIPEYIVSTLDIDYILENLIAYVNDCIGYKMVPEVTLFYSDFIFGTTDAIQYYEKERFLRIHDYKSGKIPAHMEQLYIYAALFCLEYRMKPFEMDMELRIYQNGEILYDKPNPDVIGIVMEKAIERDGYLKKLNGREV